MEERVAAFQAAAEARMSGEKLAKEIQSLRRFLHRNQDHRFTEREKSKLFTAIQVHYSNPAASARGGAATGSDGDDGDSDDSLVQGLIEDALKMPFTVFSTTQKQQLLKWLDALQVRLARSRSRDFAPLPAVERVSKRCNAPLPLG